MTNTNLPLPRRRPGAHERKNISPGITGNRGLYYHKFFNQWSDDYAKTIPEHSVGAGQNGINYHTGKMSWVLAQVHGTLPDNQQFETTKSASGGAPAGDKSQIPAAASRLASLAKASDGEARDFVTTAPFVTGMGLSHPIENGFLFHHTFGVPYLPGSSVKGMIRAFAEVWCGIEEGEDGYDSHIDEIWRLFGGPIRKEWEEDDKKKQADIRPPSVGNIIVFDALPTGPVPLMAEIITPHTADWRITKNPEKSSPADWVSPNPIPFLAVAPGASFQFALAPRKRNETSAKDLETAWGYLEQALAWTGAGAKTAIGFGRFDRAPEFQVGTRIRVMEGAPDEQIRGRIGQIETLFDAQKSAKIKLDGGGKGSNPVVLLAHLERA